MGLFDWLRGRNNSSTRQSSEPPTMSRDHRPFDVVSNGLDAWNGGDTERAEQLLLEGIEEYRRLEPESVDFPIGRYGAFLVDQGRLVEAAQVLDEALAYNTQIPATWNDYLRIMADRRDLEKLFDTTARMNQIESLAHEDSGAHMLLGHARRASREGNNEFAEAVARRILKEATARGDEKSRWAAAGELGHILERAGRVDEAIDLWTVTFDEGSDYHLTANRLSMNLERAKRYADAIDICRRALDRSLPANFEEQLRKRLDRCETKLNPSKKRKDVPVYSIREGEDVFDQQFQVRIKPPIRSLEVLGTVGRCFGVSKGVGSLVDVDLSSGEELQRIEELPPFNALQFTSKGWGIGIQRTAKIGDGPTLLSFISPDGVIAEETSVPDATSEIAFGADRWYVGCRDGQLYAFDVNGNRLWHWEMPDTGNFDGPATMRPCPYYVASDGKNALIASFGDVFSIAPSGAVNWHAELPNERTSTYTFSAPLADQPPVDDAYRAIGLVPGAPPDQVKSAYLSLAKQTHPDLNPGDSSAADKFRRVQAAYESIAAGHSQEQTQSTGISITIEFEGFGPTASFITANAAGVLVGSSQGRIYQFDMSGQIRQTRALGDGMVYGVLDADGNLAAAWCGGVLSFFEGLQVVNVMDVPDVPGAFTLVGRDVLIWRRNRVELHESSGRTKWVAEFSKNVTDIAAVDDRLVCAAGALVSFRQN